MPNIERTKDPYAQWRHRIVKVGGVIKEVIERIVDAPIPPRKEFHFILQGKKKQ